LEGQKFGSQILGGINFGEIYFQTKNLEKFPSILSKISDDLFFSHRQLFFTKLTPFIQNVLGSLCIVVSVSAFFHVYFLNKQNFKILI